MCRWFDSAPGHQEHTSRNADHHGLAFLLSELQILVSGLFPVACCVSHPNRRALPVECCTAGGNGARATMAGRVAQLSPLTTHALEVGGHRKDVPLDLRSIKPVVGEIFAGLVKFYRRISQFVSSCRAKPCRSPAAKGYLNDCPLGQFS